MSYDWEALPERDRLMLVALKYLAQVLTMTAVDDASSDDGPSLRQARRDLHAFAGNLLDDLTDDSLRGAAVALVLGIEDGQTAKELPHELAVDELHEAIDTQGSNTKGASP